MSSNSHFPLPEAVDEMAAGPSSSRNGSRGEIHHVASLSENFGSLCLSERFSDVILKVGNERIPAHKVILAARSEYFRALFYGPLQVSAPEVTLELTVGQEPSIVAFKHLMRYIYTSKLSLGSFKEELVVEILGLANMYGFEELQEAIADYLKSLLNHTNLCGIFNISLLYSLHSLTDYCLMYADRSAIQILESQSFLQLPASAIKQLISRDSFCAREIDIFRAIQRWSVQNPEQDSRSLLAHVRLPLISLDDLLNVIRSSNLLAPDAILDAIKEQTEKRISDLEHRGIIVPYANVASTSYGASVISGEYPSVLLSPDSVHHFENDRAFTRHPIGMPSLSPAPSIHADRGIVVQLANPFLINKLILQLWPPDALRSAENERKANSYYVEVSIDGNDWVRVIDYSQFLCRSKQILHFAKRAVKFIRIVGTHSTVSRFFSLLAIEALFVNEAVTVDPITNIIVPSSNVAKTELNAIVIEGVSRCPHSLLNGDMSSYDWDTGYTCHQLGSGSITIQLPQPYLVSNMRLLLWDCDNRYYSYYVEVSTNLQVWKKVADRTTEQCRSWQLLEFEQEPVVFIRIVGTHNSANEVFHCVHFECPATTREITPRKHSDASEVNGNGEGLQGDLVQPAQLPLDQDLRPV